MTCPSPSHPSTAEPTVPPERDPIAVETCRQGGHEVWSAETGIAVPGGAVGLSTTSEGWGNEVAAAAFWTMDVTTAGTLRLGLREPGAA